MDLKNLLCTSNTTTTITATNTTLAPLLSHPTVMDDMPLYSKSPAETYQHPALCWSSSSSSASTSSPSGASFYSTPPSPLSMTPPTSPAAAPNRRPTPRVSQTRTPWTPKEDYLLQQGYAEGLSWAMISSNYLPHRSRGCCWGRFKTLQTKTVEQREWSEAEDRLLLHAVKKNARLFKQAWKSVAHEMGGRHWRECELRASKVNNQLRKRHPQGM